MPKQDKIYLIQQLVNTAADNIDQAKKLLKDMVGNDQEGDNPKIAEKTKELNEEQDTEEGRIIEGVFDGQNMIGPDGKQYTIPANYASKSKLVEGDILKLTIQNDGSFIYKQIGPIDRQRKIGILCRDEEDGEYKVLVNGKGYKVLAASITYFKGEPGDEVILLTPKAAESNWAAVENVVKSLPEEQREQLLNQPANKYLPEEKDLLSGTEPSSKPKESSSLVDDLEEI